MVDIRIGYFLEDIGQQSFIEALVERVAEEHGVASWNLYPEVRNATGGRGKVMDELRRFLRDVAREAQRPFDLLIVAIDGNCHGFQERRNEILAVAKQTSYPGPTVCAVPDPHIERWYLADTDALCQVLDITHVASAPSYKCERARYKKALRDTIRQAGVIAPLGGAEYGADVAQSIDLYVVGKTDAGFKHFLDALREGLSHFASG